MAFNYATGQYDADGVDLSNTTTDSVGYVQSDVSQGAPSMSPSTPTGNGSGYYIDPNAQAAIFDTLKTGVNYAMQRDAQNQMYNRANIQTQATAVQVSQQKQKNSSLFLLIGGAWLLFMLAEGGAK
jgi:hypothetical protein